MPTEVMAILGRVCLIFLQICPFVKMQWLEIHYTERDTQTVEAEG